VPIKLQAGRPGVRIPAKVNTYVKVGGRVFLQRKRLGAILVNHTEVKNVSSCMNIPQVKNVSSCMNILQVKNVSRCMNIPQIKNVSSCMNIPQVKNVSSCMNIPQVKNVSSCMNIPQVKNVSSCMNIPHLCFHGVDMDNFTVILASYPEKNASLTLYLL